MDATSLRRLQEAYKEFKGSTNGTPATVQAGYYDYESTQYSLNRSFIWGQPYDDHRKQFTYTDRIQLLRVSNYLELNFSLYSELIRFHSRFVIASGFVPNASTGNKTYDALADFTWKQWADTPFCDVERQKNFTDQLKYLSERLVAEGECFVLFTKSINGEPRTQIISPLRVRSSGKSNDNSIDGIWYSSEGEPVAYNIFDLEDPGDGSELSGKSFTKVPAENVCHIYDTVGPTQGHGVPWAQSSFNNVRDTKDAMGFVMNGVKNEAVFTLQMKDPTGNGGAATVAGMSGQKTRLPAAGSNAQVANSIPSNVPPNIGSMNPTYLEQLGFGGKNRILNVGAAELAPVGGETPSPRFEAFINLNIVDVCQSVGIPYEFIYSPKTLNNASGEVILEKTRGYVTDVQSILMKYCQRVRAWVLSCNLDLEDVRPLGNINPFQCTWTGPRKIGQKKNDTNNDIDALNNKTTTFKEIYGNKGKDWKVEINQWLDEEAFIQQQANAKGVDLTKIVYGKGTVSLKETEAESDPDEKEDEEIAQQNDEMTKRNSSNTN
jgi:hypothetical protein